MIGTILKNARINIGLTQKELAEKLSLSDTTISSYERGNSQPDFEMIIKILDLCGYKLRLFDKNEKEIDLNKFSREI